jgi:hypothetical protein
MNREILDGCPSCWSPRRAVFRDAASIVVSVLELGLLVLALGPFDSSGQARAQAHVQSPGAEILFTIPEHDLYPENIAFDPRSGDYFLGSMGQSRILRIHPDGSYEDFVAGLEPVLQTTVGMKVDAQRRFLWVCTGRYTLFGGEAGAPSRTGVLLFNLDDGELLQSWLVDQPDPGHIFNDIALAPNGDAYVTTTLFGQVYRIRPDAEEMELLLDVPENQTNGITLDPEGRYLFFTLGRTISRLDLRTRELTEIPVPDDAGAGTDGMYFLDGALVVLKPRLGQIARLVLNESLEGVERVEVLAQGDPSFVYPTTGVLVGDDLVFVATSYANVPRNVRSREQHPDVLIQRLRIPSGGPAAAPTRSAR